MMNLRLIASKRVNVPLNPFENDKLILEAEIKSAGVTGYIALREAKRANAVVERNIYNWGALVPRMRGLNRYVKK